MPLSLTGTRLEDEYEIRLTRECVKRRERSDGSKHDGEENYMTKKDERRVK